jgi:hypothetical protein
VVTMGCIAESRKVRYTTHSYHNLSIMKTPIYEVRRHNLHRLVLDQYDGNRAALARAAKVHPNQINLLLSDNIDHRRNLGEVLARKIESELKLPGGHLDMEPAVSNRAVKAEGAASTAGLPPLQQATLEALVKALHAGSLTDRDCIELLTRIVGTSTQKVMPNVWAD